jgi:hypothetical protein
MKSEREWTGRIKGTPYTEAERTMLLRLYLCGLDGNALYFQQIAEIIGPEDRPLAVNSKGAREAIVGRGFGPTEKSAKLYNELVQRENHFQFRIKLRRTGKTWYQREDHALLLGRRNLLEWYKLSDAFGRSISAIKDRFDYLLRPETIGWTFEDHLGKTSKINIRKRNIDRDFLDERIKQAKRSLARINRV